MKLTEKNLQQYLTQEQLDEIKKRALLKKEEAKKKIQIKP